MYFKFGKITNVKQIVILDKNICHDVGRRKIFHDKSRL